MRGLTSIQTIPFTSPKPNLQMTPSRFLAVLSLFLFVIISNAQEVDEERIMPSPETANPVSVTSLFNRGLGAEIRARSAELVDNNNLASLIGVPLLNRIQRRTILSGGCPQLICFGLDGSDSISEEEYEIQTSFAHLVSALMAVDDSAQFSAVQYGLRNILISDSTANEDLFQRRVELSELAGAPRTFLAAGLGFCVQDLRGNPAPEERNIVMLGDGRSNFGTDSISSVVAQANATIYAVGIGFVVNTRLLELTEGDESRIFSLADYSMMAAAAFNLVRDVCNVNIPPF